MSGETIFSFQARYEDHFTRKVAALERELARAKLALRLEATKLAEERRRSAAAIERLEELCDGFKGSEPSRAWYTAILAKLRAGRELHR